MKSAAKEGVMRRYAVLGLLLFLPPAAFAAAPAENPVKIDRSVYAEDQAVAVTLRAIFDAKRFDEVAARRLLLEQQHHRFSAELPQDAVLVNCDPTRLAQVVSNLLNNAARYTPDGGNITLHAACDGDDVLITVRDNGIGIPEKMLSAIFEMFTQGERLSNHQGGMGIGWTLVKQAS